ncbi:DUF2867 domain-containing protein [Sphingobacterium tabacisoli]|uniref:DUF2867 domain-containing protein n=1 Tax=Sphingobacterium tabacisoli TaxID=2044855 RepID=A0ABW5L349_9SPHI|nr:DUF2867 domain-containing protein [Sphingobacterium tabacisoli]
MQKTSLPEISLLQDDKTFEFIDAYKALIDDPENEIEITKICKLFFTTGPKWIEKLFAFRNNTMKVFGLKVPEGNLDKASVVEGMKCEPGERMGLFQIFERNGSEIILGEDDKHLDFRVSLLLAESALEGGRKELTISTMVKFNNVFGRLYFAPVKPFHGLVVPSMLKAIVRRVNPI